MKRIFIFFIFLPAIIYAQERININRVKAEEEFKKGIYYYNRTSFLSASHYFIKALKYDPEFHFARVWLGKAYYKAGYVQNTLTEWEYVIKHGGGDNILREKLNTLYFLLGYKVHHPAIKSYVHLKTLSGKKWGSERFFLPTSVLATMENEIYVSGFGSKGVVKFDINGKFLKRFSGGKESFKKPYGLCFDSDGNIIITDLNKDIVQKISPEGKPLLIFGGTGTEPGKFLGPEGVAVDKFDNIYVVDTGNCRVQKFSKKGNFLMMFGKRGKGDGEFLKPTGITIDESGLIYVSDNSRKDIQVFDQDGNFIEYFEKDILTSPRNIHKFGNYFTVADGPGGVLVKDLNTGAWYNIKSWNYLKNKFMFVSDVFLRNDNFLFVSDMWRHTVDIFVPEEYKYANLNVNIEFIDTRKYPQNVIYVSVSRKDGKPVIGLTQKNFKIKEMGVPVKYVAVIDKIYKKDKIKTIFIVDKSFDMEDKVIHLKKAADYYLKNILKTRDKVKVVNVNTREWIGLDYDYRRLRILKTLEEKDYNYLGDISEVIYNSVTELLPALSRRAIILFTAGKIDEEKNFKKYSLETCMYYAKNNFVPVFIINFSSKNRDILKRLAEGTGGVYYEYFKDAYKLKKIRNKVASVPFNLYLLIYKTGAITHPLAEGKWQQVEVRVNYNKLTGKDISGYFLGTYK